MLSIKAIDLLNCDQLTGGVVGYFAAEAPEDQAAGCVKSLERFSAFKPRRKLECGTRQH
jgi:hypothetical protein